MLGINITYTICQCLSDCPDDFCMNCTCSAPAHKGTTIEFCIMKQNMKKIPVYSIPEMIAYARV